MNKIFLIGRIANEVNLSETKSGISVCRFSIAVNRRRTGEGEQQTDFFNVTAWRGTGENVARFCKKGNKVAVTGSVQIRTYETNDGVKRTAVDVVAEEVEFLSPKPDNEAKTLRKPTLEAFDDDSDIPF